MFESLCCCCSRDDDEPDRVPRNTKTPGRPDCCGAEEGGPPVKPDRRATGSRRRMGSENLVAVVLSGCGVYDGTEVHEASAVAVGLSRAGLEPVFYAPDKTQHHEVNHNTAEDNETDRNVLTESARIARGKVHPLSDLTPEKAAAVIFPGGFGAAKNLSNFATSPDLEVEPETERVIREFHAAGKPIGLCCIAPILVAAVLGEKGVKITLGKKGEGWPYSTTEGQGQDAIDKAKALGCQVIYCEVDEVCEDEENKVVTTPAYMFDGKFHQIHDGVVKMVERIVKLASV